MGLYGSVYDIRGLIIWPANIWCPVRCFTILGELTESCSWYLIFTDGNSIPHPIPDNKEPCGEVD